MPVIMIKYNFMNKKGKINKHDYSIPKVQYYLLYIGAFVFCKVLGKMLFDMLTYFGEISFHSISIFMAYDCKQFVQFSAYVFHLGRSTRIE